MSGILQIRPGSIRFAVRPINFTDASMDSYEFPWTVRNFDLLLDALESWYYYIPAGCTDIASLMRVSIPALPVDRPLGHEVFNLDDHTRALIDERYYRSFGTNVRTFIGAFTGGLGSVTLARKETSCRHETFRGTVMPHAASLPSTEVSLNYLGIPYQGTYLNGRSCLSATVSTSDPFSVDLVSVPNSYFQYSLLEWLDAIRGAGRADQIVFGNGIQWTRSIIDPHYTLTPTGLVVEHQGEVFTHPNASFPNGDVFTYHGLTTISFRLLEADRVPTPGVNLPFSGGLEHTFSYLGASRRENVGNNGPSSFTWRRDDCHVAIALSEVAIAGIADDSPIVQALDRKLHYFQESITNRYYDLVGAVMHSSSDAVRDLEGSSGINILQNLQKIPDIASMLPQIRKGVEVASRLMRRDLSFSTFAEIANLVTSTRLQSDFQWQPFIKVFAEYLPRIEKLLRGLDTHQVTGRGQASFTIPGEKLGRPGNVSLTVKTKVVLDVSSSGVSAILGVDGLGIIPKPSNIWDLIPFSFVANWITGVGGAMRRAEYSILLSMLPNIYFVHTFSFTSPLSASELTDLGLDPSVQGQTFSLRYYCRDLSFESPTPRDGYFGFGIPSGLPSFATWGSLLYQLIMG